MPQTHPTIVIGYGSHGRNVMRRLLTSAAPRGCLEWEEATDSSGSDRHLRNLSLIWVPENSQSAETTAQQDYIIKDLYRQIEEIPAGEVATAELKQAVLRAKDRLLDASARASSLGRFRVGLDVIVVARPTRAEVLGALEDMLQPALEVLADSQSLKRPAQGADLLNCIAIFDFDRFWSREAAGIRHETLASVERWIKRRHEGRPAPFRIYFVDGESKALGRRTPELRVEEEALFLEFLLFEGQRDEPSLRRLYQREGDDIDPLAAFGIRVIERSRALLSRLVAAKFACGWLRYMGGNAAPDSYAARKQIRDRLRSYHPDTLDLRGEREQLAAQIRTGLRQIQDELIEYTTRNAAGTDWPAEVHKTATAALLNLKARVSAWAGDRASEIIKLRLGNVASDLKQDVTAALQADSHAAPLGLLIEEFHEALSSLDSIPVRNANAQPPAGNLFDPFAGIDEVHKRYLRFCRRQVNPTMLAGIWWPLLAAILAVAWTPVLLAAISDMPAPDPTSAFLLRKGYELLQWLGRPFPILPILSVVFYVTGRYFGQPRIAYKVERGKQAFTHTEQGELTDRIRKALSDDFVQSEMALYCDEVFASLTRRVHNEIQRELAWILTRLIARQKEMDWLRQQLRDFLRTYGIDGDSRELVFDNARIRGSVHRSSMEQEEDLRRISKRNPMEDARYQSTQAQLKPFRDWDKPYCEAFLYPVIFLDHLSRIFEEAGDEGLIGPDADGDREQRASRLRSFIDKARDFPSCMDWGASEGQAPPLESFAVAPSVWLDLPSVRAALRDHGYTDQRILESKSVDRLHLLRIQTGISKERLLESLPAVSGGMS